VNGRGRGRHRSPRTARASCAARDPNAERVGADAAHESCAHGLTSDIRILREPLDAIAHGRLPTIRDSVNAWFSLNADAYQASPSL
jgi:hypothetical protein